MQKLCTVNTLTKKMQHGARIKSFSALQLKKKKKSFEKQTENCSQEDPNANCLVLSTFTSRKQKENYLPPRKRHEISEMLRYELF